ncbi:uncharacterized protein LOC100893090 [Strongylocentrotus purpuratus]|uniref:SCP domain-containing protein n=1 Tax=Strongylocentrotus purpuratus TaxID=7668 RepID=A0A7M7HHH3_STRPU|nr:uncharacterized protein LOC100893090 [Strongylocentrotus purpuratus]
MTPQATLFAGLVLPRILALLTLFAILADAGQPFNGEEKTAIVDRHNEIRREPGASDMNYIDWDDALASQAQSLADSCKFEHVNEGLVVGEFNTVGENIFAEGGESGDTKTGVDAVNKWYEEKAGYTWADNSCDGECGHYTQVTWAESRRVGCGRNYCPDLQGAFPNAWYIVCNYGPAGNVEGEKPWKMGDPCTECDSGSGQCFDGLCRPCSEHPEECDCRMVCENCANLNTECKCECPNGFRGVNCAEICEDVDPTCGANPGWPDADSCSLGDFVPLGCPLMCGVCNAQDPDFVCDGSTQTGTGTGTGTGTDTDTDSDTGKERGGGGRQPSGGQGGGEGEVTGDICTQTFTAATYVDDELFLFHGGKLWKVSSSGELLSPAEGENAQDSFIKLPNDISAVYQRKDGNVVFLRDQKMFIFQDNKRVEGHPIKIVDWGVEKDVAGAAHDRRQDKTYFFKGPQVWRYNEKSKRIDNGYPKSISTEYDSKVNKPNFVFSDNEGNFFFVKLQKVFRISAGGNEVDTGYPKPFAPEFFSDC